MIKPPRADAAREETAALVKAFLAFATSAFAPVVAEAASSFSLIVQEGSDHGLVAVSPEQITHVFLAKATFSNARITGEIVFGDREYSVNTMLGPVTCRYRFGLWEWADALNRSDLVSRSTDFVLTNRRLGAIVENMAKAVVTLQKDIVQASPSVIARIEEARAGVQRVFQARNRADDYRRASSAAADAFRLRDYRRVVTLLEPHLSLLTEAEQKKLAYAKERL